MHIFKLPGYIYTHAIYQALLPLPHITYSLPPMHVANSLPGNSSCSENVAYDTVGNTLKISPQANVNCSENIAYDTITNTPKKSQ